MLLFAIAIAVATFIWKLDFGTSSALMAFFEAGGSKFYEPYLVLPSCTTSTATGSFHWNGPASKCLHHHHLIGICGAVPVILVTKEWCASEETSMHFIYRTIPAIQSHQRWKILLFWWASLFSAKGNNKFSKAYQIGSDLIEVKLNGTCPTYETAVEDANGCPWSKWSLVVWAGRKNTM